MKQFLPADLFLCEQVSEEPPVPLADARLSGNVPGIERSAAAGGSEEVAQMLGSEVHVGTEHDTPPTAPLASEPLNEIPIRRNRPHLL